MGATTLRKKSFALALASVTFALVSCASEALAGNHAPTIQIDFVQVGTTVLSANDKTTANQVTVHWTGADQDNGAEGAVNLTFFINSVLQTPVSGTTSFAGPTTGTSGTTVLALTTTNPSQSITITA